MVPETYSCSLACFSWYRIGYKSVQRVRLSSVQKKMDSTTLFLSNNTQLQPQRFPRFFSYNVHLSVVVETITPCLEIWSPQRSPDQHRCFYDHYALSIRPTY